MNVILDSNIFKSNFLLKGYNFDILFDYLERTNSKIIIPRVVYDEVVSLYKIEIEKLYSDYVESKENFFNNLTNEISNDFNFDFDVSKLILDYENYLEKKLKIDDSSFLEYKDGYLQEVVRRAINRIKPTKSDGKDFRDSLIWISILDYAKGLQMPIAFISDNVSDFADSDKISLDKTLYQECIENNVEIKYSRSLKDFIKGQIDVLGFVNEEWFGEQLDWFDFQSQMIDFLNEKDIQDDFVTTLRKWKFQSVESVDFLEITDFPGYDIGYIYEMLNGEIMVSAVVYSVLDVDVTYVYWDSMNEGGSPSNPYFYSSLEKIGCDFNITLKIIDRSVISLDINNVVFIQV